MQFIPSPYQTQQQSIFLSCFCWQRPFSFEYFHSFVEYPMDYHLLRSFTLAMHVPPHDKTLENHITFPKESENTTLSTCKHRCLNHECTEYTIHNLQYIETSHRPRFKSKFSRTRQKKTGKQTYTDYVVLAIWAIGGPNFDRPVVKMVANATGRVLILLPVDLHFMHEWPPLVPIGATFTKLAPTVHLDMIYWYHVVVCVLDQGVKLASKFRGHLGP